MSARILHLFHLFYYAWRNKNIVSGRWLQCTTYTIRVDNESYSGITVKRTVKYFSSAAFLSYGTTLKRAVKYFHLNVPSISWLFLTGLLKSTAVCPFFFQTNKMKYRACNFASLSYCRLCTCVSFHTQGPTTFKQINFVLCTFLYPRKLCWG